MTKYSAQFTPPAPVADIILRNIETRGLVRNVPMQLDTGADVTLIPRVFCEQLGINVLNADPVQITGFDGSITALDSVNLDLIFINKLFRGKFLILDQAEGIIGRDILNSFKLVLDGPALEWSKSPTLA